jgi:uncharacterized protein (TIGR03437 family)
MMAGGTRNFLVAGGAGLIYDSQPVAGLSVSVLGGAALVPNGGVTAYSADTRFLRVDFQYGMVASEGARHLIFSIPGDMYVLPAGLTLTGKLPPSITSVAAGLENDGTRVVRLGGTNLSASTSIYFDGVRASIRRVDEETKDVVVVAPPAAGGHRAIVTAVNTDAQSSLFLQASAPATYTYDQAETASFTVSPTSLPAGSEAMVEISGFGTNFQEGRTVVVGFGSPDVFVRRLWVLSPTRILANVAVSAGAAITPTQVSVISGLQTAALPFGFQIQAANSSTPILSPTVVNVATGQALVCAGCSQTITLTNFSAMSGFSGIHITVNDQPATLLEVTESQVTFQIPAGLPLGPAIVRLQAGAAMAQPIVVMIEPPPPAIISVGDKAFLTLGEVVTVTASGFGDSSEEILASRVSISVGGVRHTAFAVTGVAGQPGVYQVQFVLSAHVTPGAQVPLTLTFDGRLSSAVAIAVRPQQTENQ